ncbi:hypothetical protein LTR36_001919 [Oleoguttula mirabilis]|uniref:AMP-activated protein kinase glycogen-binding domain-containing protein n=1 Tax=Oleoguttula mirabilis TaxID=1507867 RepID=A0AAV9JMZ3_9PEZI|nr:hypothetical protein LTR36_001919 [Oleoguttula mirabilis]
MFPKKFSNPLKSSIDTVLGTAKSTFQAPGVTVTAPASPPPPSADSTPTAPAPPTPDTTPTTPATPVPAAPIPLHPAAAAFQRPSWIGPPRPDRPVTPGITIMKQPVAVEYASPGLQPPVYVFTSLSDPQWNAVEMDSEKKDDGKYRFSKSFAAEEGEYQYKFRLGPGDWWALNESAPIVDDGAGNKNNLMVVKPAAPPQSSQPHVPTPANQPQPAANPAVQAVKATEPPMLVVDAPRAEQPPSIKMPPVITLDQPAPTPAAATLSHAPLMKHETFFPVSVDIKNETDVEPDYSYDGDDQDDEEDDGPPLLRHESFAPGSEEQTQAPLLRHESMAIGEHLDDDYSGRQSPPTGSPGSVYSSGDDSVAPEADPNDLSLERFPTDQNGIFEHIHRASTQMAEDELHDDADLLNSVYSTSGNQSTSPITSLPSVQEDDEEELDELRDYEREKAKKEAQDDDKVDPLAPALTITEPDQAYPDQEYEAPITPPMTPQEAEKLIERVIEEDPAAAAAAETIMERAFEAKQAGEDDTQGDKIIERIIEEDPAAAAAAETILKRAIEAEHAGQDDTQGEKVVAEFVQERGLIGTFADFMTHPMAWLAVAGVALAVAAGWWKLR